MGNFVSMISSAIYAFLLLIIIAVFIAAKINHRRSKQNLLLMLLSVNVMGWVITDFAVLYVNNININIFIWNVSLIFVAFAPVLLFFILFHFFIPNAKLPMLCKVVLIGMPSITTVITLTANFHSLLRVVENLTVWPRITDYYMGPWIFIHAPFSLGLLVVSFVVVIYGLVKKTNSNLTSSILLLFALIVILLSNLAYMLDFWTIAINPTSMGAAVALLLVHMALTDGKYGVVFRMFNTLKSRITFPVLMAMLLMVVILTVYIARSTRLLVEYLETEKMNATSQAIHAYLGAVEQQTRIATTAMSESSELIRLINAYEDGTGSLEAIWQYTFDRKQQFSVYEIVVGNADGFILTHSIAHGLPNDSWDNINLPSLPLERRTFYTPTPTADMVMTSTAPILDGDRIIGTIAVSFVIGCNDFLDEIKAIFGVDATVFDSDGWSVASTLIHPHYETRATGTQARRDIIDRVLRDGQHMPLELNVFQIRPFNAYYFPLPGVDGLPNAMFFVGISREHGTATIGEQLRNVVLIAFLGLVVVSILMYFLIRNSLMPLGIFAKNVNDVANGNININIDRSKITTGEIGMLTQDVCGLIDVTKDLVQDLSIIHHEYNKLGNSKFRLDSSKYQNSFKEMVESINKIFDEDIENKTSVVHTINQINAGNFDVEIRDMPGDFVFQPQALHAVIANLKELYESATFLATNAAAGQLDVRVESTKFTGSWAALVSSLNQLMAAVAEPFDEITGIMHKLQEGDFSNRIETKYQGVFEDMANTLNVTLDEISDYINEIEDILADMAAGNLQRKIERDYLGSFDLIKRSVNSILSRLNATMEDIDNVASGVSGGASQLSQSSISLSTGITEKITSLDELSKGIKAINTQSVDNASSAQKAADWASSSKKDAEAGNMDMQRLLESMANIASSVDRVSKINDTINGIAFQTNLLALNASVEAARAGEHGRGFAVVANEVRTLANRTSDAAKQAVDLMNATNDSINEGKERANDTANSLDKIVAGVVGVSDVVGDIYKASLQQTNAISDISVGLTDINSLIQNDAATSEETAAAAEELDAQVIILKDKLSFFRTRIAALNINSIWEGAAVPVSTQRLLNDVSGNKLSFNKGDIIIHEGDANAENMYFVISGNVDIYKAFGKINQTFLATLKPGDFFGEISLFLNEQRTASVVATEQVTIMEINESGIYSLMDKKPDIAYSIIETLCTRFKNMLLIMDAY